jgi:hypothetical protein
MFFESKTFWLAKDAAQPEQYQDAYALDGKRGIAAIADGVASSLFSSLWARILTDGVIANPPDIHDPHSLFGWLGQQRARWSGSIDINSLAWHQKAKIQQGAQATLLWLQVLPPDPHDTQCRTLPRLLAYAVGDCTLIHARGSQMLRAFPIEHSRLFENNPQAIASIDGKHDESLPLMALEDYCQPGDLLVLCTDAVGAWALKALEDGATLLWRDFWNMTQEDWAAYIGRLRQEQRMRYDDATLVLLKISTPPEGLTARSTQFIDEAKRKIEDVTSSAAESLSDFFDNLSRRMKK